MREYLSQGEINEKLSHEPIELQKYRRTYSSLAVGAGAIALALFFILIILVPLLSAGVVKDENFNFGFWSKMLALPALIVALFTLINAIITSMHKIIPTWKAFNWIIFILTLVWPIVAVAMPNYYSKETVDLTNVGLLFGSQGSLLFIGSMLLGYNKKERIGTTNLPAIIGMIICGVLLIGMSLMSGVMILVTQKSIKEPVPADAYAAITWTRLVMLPLIIDAIIIIIFQTIESQRDNRKYGITSAVFAAFILAYAIALVLKNPVELVQMYKIILIMGAVSFVSSIVLLVVQACSAKVYYRIRTITKPW